MKKILTMQEYRDEMCQEAFERGKRAEEERSKRLCDKCNSYQEGIIKGKAQAVKEVLEIIDKIAIKPKANSTTQYTPYVYYESLIKEIQAISNSQQITNSEGKKMSSAVNVEEAKASFNNKELTPNETKTADTHSPNKQIKLVTGRTAVSKLKGFSDKTDTHIQKGFYKCGHESGTIILDDSPLSMTIYFDWKDTFGFDGDKSLCFDCYCKSKEKKCK